MGGKFAIILTSDAVIFRNSGDKSLNKEILFERFQKNNKSDGAGLGLTLVKNICNLYHWEIRYEFEQGLHNFKISFISDFKNVV
jgi:K+-sensing histidine kinase KdpD